MDNNLGNKETMARNIQYYMNLKNVSRNDLCKALDVPYTTLRDWLKAITYPRIDKIEMMANYFNISKADLVEEKTKTEPTQTNKISDTGQRIKEKRLLAGISIEELAEQSNVSADIITRLETGVPTSFDSKILKSIARVLKTNMDYLAGWSDDGTKLDPPNPFDAIFDTPQQPVAYIHGSDGASKTITDKDMIDLIDKFFEVMEEMQDKKKTEKKDKK